LAKTRSFSLFCAYPLGHFAGQQRTHALGELAAAHEYVVPTERFTQLTGDARAREVLLLQQKAASLEAEVQQRQLAEDQLRLALIGEQAARQAAEAALRQRDEFVSVASHELKTPLTTLSGYAQLVLRRFAQHGELVV